RGRRHPADHTEPEKEALTERVAMRQPLGRVDGQPVLLDESAIARERLRVAVADVADEAAAAGPCREVFGASPVDLVVARAKAWSRPVRDLVVLEASRAGRVRQATGLRDRRLLGWCP